MWRLLYSVSQKKSTLYRNYPIVIRVLFWGHTVELQTWTITLETVPANIATLTHKLNIELGERGLKEAQHQSTMNLS